MKLLTCPYCYHEQDPRRLLFVCTGQGAPGRSGCDPVSDADRQRETGFGGAAMPVFQAATTRNRQAEGMCPNDGSWSRKRACRQCHTPIPPTLVRRPSPVIGMVGDIAAGKTVYLTVLKRELRAEVGERFKADVAVVGEHQPGLLSIEEYIRQFERALYDDKKLPGRTPPPQGRARVPLLLEWRHPTRGWIARKSTPSTILPFCDAAGEDRVVEVRQRYMRSAGGLILLLDPYQLPQVRDRVGKLPEDLAEPAPLLDTVVAGVTQVIRTHPDRPITVPVAVVLAKLDVFDELLGEGHFLRRAEPRRVPAYDEDFGQQMHGHVKSLLHQYGGADLVTHFTYNYANFRFFAVSSLGALPDYERLRVDERGVQPRYVAEPLLWLMSRRGIIKQVDGG
ncbi:zinc ribbon domain-containing protein [Pseudonocardia sp. TRM90224]|uniref:zinc ribbon domain-containing protein n=1 Tax=Pseudonocardia sp. TRM90224 TaxID=2812678 RepID=UPI001E3D2393|nr:zinc ribbon domain-containing protein [Pseudonocardia sp. TRM90224]